MFELLTASARQAASLSETGHRPWPPARRRWLMGQTWADLLFAHWRLPYDALRPHVPSALELERFDGDAWLGVTPFVLRNLRLHGVPPLPRLSTFPEVNVRTYVTAGGKPGIWFFSLDAASAVAVEAARRMYRLPYHRARMSVRREGDCIRFASARTERGGDPVVLSVEYGPAGEPFHAAKGSLEEFLVERYCLYAAARSRLYRAEIHHPPWPLQAASLRVELNTMPPADLELPDEEPLLHFSARQDAVIWPLESV